MSVIELRLGPMRAALRPDLGASIAGLWFDGVPVLRSADDPAALQSPREAGCFPLAPYSNRIGWRRFTWQGRTHELAADSGNDEPHALHGSAWRAPWRVVHADDARATLAYAHAPDAAWPFAFEVEQRFELLPAGIRVEMDLRNTDASVQPTGLGWHPYFPRRASSRIHVECSTRWERDAATKLPTHRVPQRGIDAEVRHLDFDHVFEGWPGHARVRDEALAVTIASSLPYLVVFTPPQQPHFCVEPVSHVIDAIRMDTPAAHGIVALAPGDTMRAWMTLEAAPR
jgi:aldose 1-epimerase